MASQKTSGTDYTGKLGPTVSYLLNGKMVKRTIGFCDKPPTILQLRFRAASPLINDFLKVVKEFIRLGYGGNAVSKPENFVNLAYKEIYRNALTGTYPALEIDFAKVLLSKGDMPATAALNANGIPAGIEFCWDPNSNKGCKWNDIAMVLAYVPELNLAEFLVSGANRKQGYEILPFTDLPTGTVIHTYITFISANHTSVSDSVYTGALTWM